MKKIELEIWADSFHEGNWCCSNIARILSAEGGQFSIEYANGFQPIFHIIKENVEFALVVFGSYKSWDPVPQKITEILNWGKPDFIAYDPARDMVLFAVEETAATATGNQTAQRCERQYGSLRFGIPYWYLVSEYGLHIDGGARRDSIWPTVAGLKLSILKRTPCVVVHYSDIENLEDYQAGKGLDMLFRSITTMLKSYCDDEPILSDLEPLLKEQYEDMLHFLTSQWSNVVDYLPSLHEIQNDDTAERIAEFAINSPEADIEQVKDFLHWPLIGGLPKEIRENLVGKSLLKYDKLCELFENDVTSHLAYTLSANASSGKPRTTAEIRGYIEGQKRKFSSIGLTPPASFSLHIEDFPFTNSQKTHHHTTTAKNIVYLYDRWSDFVKSAYSAYPRLKGKLSFIDNDIPVFVYVSNSIKLGRVFGDPFTGQIAAYATAFGKFDPQPRKVVAYFPHQVHNQVFDRNGGTNKGITLMSELTDLIIFHGGIAVDLQKGIIL
ncbi:MAG: hypothetical protein ACYDH1_01575 [Anaerolineaceae bacterium]